MTLLKAVTRESVRQHQSLHRGIFAENRIPIKSVDRVKSRPRADIFEPVKYGHVTNQVFPHPFFKGSSIGHKVKADGVIVKRFSAHKPVAVFLREIDACWEKGEGIFHLDFFSNFNDMNLPHNGIYR